VAWLNGSYTGGSADETIQMNSEAIGRARAYALMSELELMDLDDDELEIRYHDPRAEQGRSAVTGY